MKARLIWSWRLNSWVTPAIAEAQQQDEKDNTVFVLNFYRFLSPPVFSRNWYDRCFEVERQIAIRGDFLAGWHAVEREREMQRRRGL